MKQNMPQRDPGAELRKGLVDALVDVPFMGALAERRLLVDLIRRDLNDFPDVAEHSAARMHTVEIVVSCLTHAGGLRALLAALRMMGPDFPGVTRVGELIGGATVASLLPDGEAARVRDLLRRVEESPSAGSVREAVARLFKPSTDAEGLVAVFDHYAAEHCTPAVVPTVVLIVDAVAELCEAAELGLELRRWVEKTAARHEAEADLRDHRARNAAFNGPSEGFDIDVDVPPVAIEEGEFGPASDTARSSLSASWAGSPVDRLGEITSPVEVSAGRASGRPLVWGDVPQRNPGFTGRGDLLARLHEELTRSRQTAVLPKALHGMGGVGKSQVAIEYVYRHSAEYDLIWWIPAEQPSRILDSLTRLAERLDLGAGPEANVAVPMVREALSTGGLPYERWLLVFDNAEAPDGLQRYLPTGGAGKILVTSQDMDWARVTRVLEVDVFERSESVAFLRNHDPDLAEVDADRLAEALGDLPVAVEQAAAWRAATVMPVDEYLELLGSKRIELLDASPSPDYGKSVAAVWQVSLDKLRDINPGALRLLQICSFLAPEPINMELFAGLPLAPIIPEFDALLRDTFKLNRAIRDVQRYALARIDRGTRTLQIHRLLQAVLIASLGAEDKARLRLGAHLLLANSNPGHPDSRADWPRYQALLPHVLASDAVESPHPRVHKLVFDMARFLFYWGDHQGGQELVQRAFECRVVDRGESVPHTLTVGKWLGWMRQVNGDYAGARELNERLLVLYRTERGDDDEGTIDAMSLVATDLLAGGEFTAARDLCQLAYTNSRRVFGEDDETTLISAHSLGVALRWTGEYDRAAELDQATHTRSEVVFGAASARTLSTLNCLTVDLIESGHYIDGRRRQEDVYRRHVEAFGVESPSTLGAARTLAVARRKAGDHEGAMALSRDTFEKYRRRYGDEYPMTLAAALNHAVDLRYAGRLHEALDLGKNTSAAYERMFGPRHCLTLSAHTSNAVVLRLRGDPEAASRFDGESVALLTETLGADHPTTLICATNLASDFAALGRAQEAYEKDADTLRRSERVLGVEHPSTLACGMNRALDLRALGRDAEADRARADAISRLNHVLGGRHPMTLNASGGTRTDCDVDPDGL